MSAMSAMSAMHHQHTNASLVSRTPFLLQEDLRPAKPRGFRCRSCMNEQQFVLQDNLLICEVCGATLEHSKYRNISYKDIDRVNITCKYQYDRITHFKDCIQQFQGKQNATIPPAVYSDLIFQFLQHGLIPENYKDIPKKEAFKAITKEHILLFLKETNHTKHYEDVTLLHHYFTEIAPPDLSAIENALLQDFDALTALYDKKYRNSERRTLSTRSTSSSNYCADTASPARRKTLTSSRRSIASTTTTILPARSLKSWGSTSPPRFNITYTLPTIDHTGYPRIMMVASGPFSTLAELVCWWPQPCTCSCQCLL